MKRTSINALGAQCKQIQAKKDLSYTKARQLEDDLNAAFDGTPIHGTSDDTMLELTGLAEGIYGRLCYDGEALRVLSRDTDDDLYDDAHGIAEDERHRRSRALDECDPKWLDRLLAPKLLESLYASLRAELDQREREVDQSLTALDTLLAAESAALSAQMAVTLDETDNAALIRNWSDALDATDLEPADGLTRSSRMLESVCTFILNERQVPLPDPRTMTTLAKACLDCLTWPTAGEARQDVNQLRGGVLSIMNAVGALRTHFGTAHGASSHLPPLDPAFSRLARNACATIAIFLIDRHQHGDVPPQPEGRE
ncbi:abortive infection family protein [Burkholderia multivorans]|uniref:abortive infection family protein n=1 Tax=Burkholderia multivorans TaxID=87883 RepID=UPI0015898485|nr:abortive infection family protein [Burkholderia multivorans]